MIIETTGTKTTKIVVFNLCGVTHAGVGKTLSDAAENLADILVDKVVAPLANKFEQAGGLLGEDVARAAFFEWARSVGYTIEIVYKVPDTEKSFGIAYKSVADLKELDQQIDAGCELKYVDFENTDMDDVLQLLYHVDVGVIEFTADGGVDDYISTSAPTLDQLKEKLAIKIKDFLLNHRQGK